MSNPYVELILESIQKSGFMYFVNNGSGMRYLLNKNETIGVVDKESFSPKVGDIALVNRGELISGGRIVRIFHDEIGLKSDCGHGKEYFVAQSDIVGYVSQVEINGNMYPLFSDNHCTHLHRKIASISVKVKPQNSWNPLALLKRKIYILLIRQHQKSLRTYLATHTKPVERGRHPVSGQAGSMFH